MSAEPRDPRGDPAPEGAGSAVPDRHDESGLDLARSIAAGLRGAARAADPRRTRAATLGSALRRRARRWGGPTDPALSGAHPDDRDPQPLDATLDRVVTERGWGTDVAVHGVFARWPQIVGSEVAQHCVPERYADSRLSVRADSTAWATQMRLLAPTVLRRLNDELGPDTVLRIEVHGPQPPSWTKGRRSLRDARGPRDTYG